MNPIIVIDIDDILHDMNRALRDHATEQGIGYKDYEVTSWDFVVRRFGLDGLLSTVDKIFRADTHYVYEDAALALQRLSSTHELHYFTDRPEGYEEVTETWLREHGFPQSQNLHICRDKRDDIQQLDPSRIVAIIDDRPRTMVWALYEMKIPRVFSLRCAYNTNMSDIPGIHLADTWPELETIITHELTA